MRYTSFILLLTLASALSAQEFRQAFLSYNQPEPVIKNIVRYNSATNSRDRIYINSDYCSYMVVRQGARYYNASPGENIVESRPVQSQAAEGTFAKTNFRFYRGIFPKKEPAQGCYAMPLAAGERIQVKPNSLSLRNSDRKEDFIAFRVQSNDTVYAMRGGIACLVGDNKGVIINHVDETFAVYHHMRKALVQPGDAVEVGQPVGLAASDAVYVGFVYLDEKYFNQKEVPDEYPYTHFIPQLWDGIQYIRYNETVTVTVPDLTEELVTQDMSKAQKKRYLKHKNKKQK